MDARKRPEIASELAEYIKKSVAESPFYSFMGISITDLAQGYTRFEVNSEPRHCNAIGLVQGGLLLSLADAAMGNAVRTLGQNGVTVDITGSYVKPAPFGANIWAEAEIIKANKTLVYGQARVFTGDSLLLLAQGTFFVKEPITLK